MFHFILRHPVSADDITLCQVGGECGDLADGPALNSTLRHRWRQTSRETYHLPGAFFR